MSAAATPGRSPLDDDGIRALEEKLRAEGARACSNADRLEAQADRVIRSVAKRDTRKFSARKAVEAQRANGAGATPKPKSGPAHAPGGSE